MPNVRITKVSENGQLPPPGVVAGTKSTLTIPRIERWVDVPDYPGYQARLWINYPRALRSAFDLSGILEAIEGMSEAEAEAYGLERRKAVEDALAAIVLEHNGWPDEDGNVLPQPTDPTMWDKADQHLQNVVMRLALQAPALLPNSQRPTGRR